MGGVLVSRRRALTCMVLQVGRVDRRAMLIATLCAPVVSTCRRADFAGFRSEERAEGALFYTVNVFEASR